MAGVRHLVSLIVAGGLVASPMPAVAAGDDAASSTSVICQVDSRGAVAEADDLLANRYTLGRHPTVHLPANPRWNENPIGDPNWAFNFHALRWVESLWAAWTVTHRRAYRARYEFILRDWVNDNSRDHPPSAFSWHDHATALRATVLVCALDRLPRRRWLTDAVMLHGRTLASEQFYVQHGNHALNQASGLLAVACRVDNAAWRRLGTTRVERLGRESIDSDGATNEQSLGYETYNYLRYSGVIDQMKGCRIRPPAGLEDRVGRMVRFMRMSTLPNGHFEMIGDTLDDQAPAIARAAEDQAIARAADAGPLPPSWVYRAGYAFFRSGWGEHRALADETAVSVRFGPGAGFHGHDDAAAVTMYSAGDRVLLDPGLYHYKSDGWRDWFHSAAAHNTVSADGVRMTHGGSTRLVAKNHGSTYDFVALEHSKIPGVTHKRRVFYSRALDVLVVDDDLRSSGGRRTFRQWWHLHPGARPHLERDGFFTGRRHSRANAWVIQLAGHRTQTISRGLRNPRQGWVSFAYNRRLSAPVLDARASGTRVRFVTLIVPSPSGVRGWRVHGFRLDASGFRLDIESGGVRAGITVRNDHASQRVISRG